MNEALFLPDINRELGGISDPFALQMEVDGLRDRLTESTHQLFLERQFAMDVHRARSVAIIQSPALKLVYGVEDEARVKKPRKASDMMSGAYGVKVNGAALPDGFADQVTDSLHRATHPDMGGDEDVAKEVNEALQMANDDPTYSILRALVAAGSDRHSSASDLRIERYRLSMAIDGAKPQFESTDIAHEHAQEEIDGAEWRVRANAALMSIELLLGSNEAWSGFIQSVVRERKMELVSMVNRVQPELMSLQERIVKGKPMDADELDTDAIDAVLERVWSTIKKKGGTLPYNPPYQNWLDILLPAIRLLDPGQMPGEHYTRFEPPITVVSSRYSEPENYNRQPFGFGSSNRNKESIYNEKKTYRDNYNY